MSDRYRKIAASFVGKTLFRTLGLPAPVVLDRVNPQSQQSANGDFITGKVLVGAAPGATLVDKVISTLAATSAEICCQADAETASVVVSAAAKAGGKVIKVQTGQGDDTRFKALVFDATGIGATPELRALHGFFSPVVRQVKNCGRIVVLGTPMGECVSVSQCVAMRALEGFTRSLGKEVGRKGITVQLLYVGTDVDTELASPLRFCLSPRSAYVSAQVLQISKGAKCQPPDWTWPLAGKVALVTGASRGIGQAIAEVMARDGAKVICLDLPQAAMALEQVASRIGGGVLTVDITAANASNVIADTLEKGHGGVDIVVHNAGITRDKTLGNMEVDWWDTVVDSNLSSAQRINDELLRRTLIRGHGRIVCVSSMSGIAGNFGQTNYATSKAGVIGYVQAMAAPLAKQAITINAVAPGFIETQMTAAMPLITRELGRRMNSLSQGGLPQDVAETVAFFASPASSGVNGHVIRVCGQSILGA